MLSYVYKFSRDGIFLAIILLFYVEHSQTGSIKIELCKSLMLSHTLNFTPLKNLYACDILQACSFSGTS